MNTSVLLAIAALLATSCLVRILPVFVTLNLTDASRRLLERVLPTAVFINFAVYILYSEADKAPLAATLALALVAGIAVATRLGLIITAVLGSACYCLLQAWFVG